MIKYLKEIVLDFSGGASGQRIVAKQGDKKSRFIKITPILNGQKLNIDADCTIDLRCTKPDKTTVRAKGRLDSDGKIIVELPEQALAVTGDVKSDVAIIGNEGEILSSSEFIIEVRGTPTNTGEYIPSEDYFKRESDIDMNNHQLKNLSAPQDAQDAATKKYVDSELQTAAETIGAVKVDRLDVDTAEDGLYVTKSIYSEAGIYIESGVFLVFVSAQTATDKRVIINSSKNGFLSFSNGTTYSVFDSEVSEYTEDSRNAPTTGAVYRAIQEALYVNTEEVIA